MNQALSSCIRAAQAVILGGLAACSVAATAATPAAPAPVAEVRDQPSTHHGVAVPDPYRWMEDLKSPATQGWMRAQGDAARATLDRIEQRAQIEARLTELRRSGDAVRQITRMPGDRIYYLKRGVADNQFKLVMRQGLAGPERVLVDPAQKTARTGVPHAINHYQPSWDGRYLAYGLSAGGSEQSDLRILDLATGQHIGQPVPRVLSEAAWLPNSRGLLYNQLKQLGPDEPPSAYYMDSRLWLQRLPTARGPVPAPLAVFGRGVDNAPALDRLDVAEPITAAGSPWLVVRTTDTTVPEGKLFVVPVAQIGRKPLRWRSLGGPEDRVQSVGLKGQRLYVMTQAEAPRNRVVVVGLAKGTLKSAQEVVAQPTSGRLEWMQPSRSGVIVGHRTGTALQPLRYAEGDRVGRAVALPAPGAVWPSSVPAADSDELIVSFSGWTEPGRHMLLKGQQAQPIELRTVVPVVKTVPMRVTEVEFPSHDGVKVPMTLLHREGLVLDGSNPVLLMGYASYGLSFTAGFWPGNITWVESGGVVALVNARGSGVHGRDWHMAGFKQTKRNTWLDGVAAARWLIAQGYGSPKTMTAMGTSAGGVFVGRATTTAPELFAAAVYDVAVLDTVRVEETANGVTNISEFGTVKQPDEFKALLEMSTYHAIRDGTAYPAVMLVHGLNDPRVDSWHSAKTAARLQAASSSGRPVLLRLDAQAGHGMGSTASQRDAQQADVQSFLLWQTGKLKLND